MSLLDERIIDWRGTSAVDNLDTTPRTGLGMCRGHHGELLQGAFWIDGSLVRALVTLPLPDVAAVASAELSPDQAGIVVQPEWKTKAGRAARLTLDLLGVEHGCQVSLSSDIPVGLGLGSSTADVVATIRAVSDAAGHRLPGRTVARLAIAAEYAADSVMFSGSVPLFAHREGRVLDVLGPELPPLLVVGCVLAPTGVDTLELPPAEYTPAEISQLGALLGATRHAVRHGDPVLLGRVATRSAEINQRFVPLPLMPELRRLAEAVGAVGVQVAHSGTVAGVLFDGRDPRAARAASERCRAGLASLGIAETYRYAPYESHWRAVHR
ncbi:hypothetical protein [Plantactinospora sp. KLBMP9567]|uniref:GHMP family kinase ATP-binding protein n=1 Tax=Plantactinospora sp. KLBMP9567 TaxID=3085900 RepID=UPI00298146F0|nr:hypothetical protein [Plantactinospora sp. KLBMP9567]MDW5328514.1 hypothetical protein [Plantactinospora sp. KLBMP9567]